jgi:phosphoserine aminotransferase
MAYEEAKKYCSPHLVSPIVEGFSTLPKQCDIVDDSAYLYYTDNETVNGLEFEGPPNSNN